MSAEHLTHFHGLPVFDLPARDETGELPAPESVAWRVSSGYNDDEGFNTRWEYFLQAVDTTRVSALVIGMWGDPGDYDGLDEEVERMVAAKERFPALRAYFLADLEMEEAEISWIEQTDLSPLLQAYPELEELGARGGHRVFTPLKHEHLRVLRLESGGMAKEVVRGISESELPALERLELWLGDENYGGDTEVADLATLLSGTRFPALRHLGLQDSPIQDAIAEAVASAPVVPTLETLRLSMGALTDDGAEALLTGQPLTHLTHLDLHYHFLTDEMMQRLREALEPAGVEVDLSEQEKPDEHNGEFTHYIAVAE